MELQQLRYVCAIADTGNFSRAAERCQVAQPSLSQQVLKLEEDLGAKLFDRLGRSVRVTEAGRAFIPHARAIVEQMLTQPLLQRSILMRNFASLKKRHRSW
jgi:LysR family hydrogen peroxide-inducible transcriptional activator